MNLIFKKITIATLLTIATSSLSHAEPSTSEIESLTPELRQLLQSEMQALQKGMMSIIPAYVSGDWNEIADIAEKMKNSYIMKRSLTDAQKKELHASLSDAFVKQDQQFHYLAGMLNHAAKKEKPELVGFYFSKMGEACVNCHSQFAAHKFPAFSPSAEQHKHTH